MIDKAKTYKTRDGQAVRIYATDGGGSYPVHGATRLNNGEWVISTWDANGRTHLLKEMPCDIIEVKPRIVREVWANVYPEGCGNTFPSKEEADRWRISKAVACVKLIIDCEEGEGL